MRQAPMTGPRAGRRPREQRSDLPCASVDSDPERALTSAWLALQHDLLRYVSFLAGGDAHAAEDVVQETWMRLWQHRETLEDGLPLLGWLRTVARNIFTDRIRRRRARPAEVALALGVEGVCPDEVERIDALDSVAITLSVLSPRHRAVVHEVYVRDRPVAEVASEFGIPVGTVKSRCHTALRQLRSYEGRGATGRAPALGRV